MNEVRECGWDPTVELHQEVYAEAPRLHRIFDLSEQWLQVKRVSRFCVREKRKPIRRRRVLRVPEEFMNFLSRLKTETSSPRQRSRAARAIRGRSTFGSADFRFVW